MNRNEEMNEIRMSLPEGVVASGFFTDNDLRVLDALVLRWGTDYAKENGEFFLTNDAIKQETGVDSKTLSRSLRKLEEHGFITRTPGKRTAWGKGEATVYVVHEDAMRSFDKVKQRNNATQVKKHATQVENQGVMKKSKKMPPKEENMPPKLKINELRELLGDIVAEQLSPIIEQLREINANLLKMSLGGINEHLGDKNGNATPETDTETEKESIKSISPVDTSPVLKEIERKKNKKNPDGDAPLASRDDDHGHFLFEMTADAVKGPSGGQPRSATESTTLNAQARENDNPPAPRCTTVFGNDAFKGSLSAPEPQNELSLTRSPETPPDATHEPQVASCEETQCSRDDAWYEEAIREAEATGNREMLRQLYAQRRNESFIATFGQPASAPKPYPDTEPLGNVIYEHASTREARIERKATTRYA